MKVFAVLYLAVLSCFISADYSLKELMNVITLRKDLAVLVAAQCIAFIFL